MKIKTDTLAGPALLWAVLEAERKCNNGDDHDVVALTRDGVPEVWYEEDAHDVTNDPRPCYNDQPYVDRDGNPRAIRADGAKLALFGNPVEFDWNWAGQLIQRWGIGFKRHESPAHGKHIAVAIWDDKGSTGYYPTHGPNELTAVGRCFVLWQLGHEVEVPDILLGDNWKACDQCGTPTVSERRTLDLPEEGNCCGVCGDWVCNECLDWKASQNRGEYPQFNGADCVCKRCARGENHG